MLIRVVRHAFGVALLSAWGEASVRAEKVTIILIDACQKPIAGIAQIRGMNTVTLLTSLVGIACLGTFSAVGVIGIRLDTPVIAEFETILTNTTAVHARALAT